MTKRLRKDLRFVLIALLLCAAAARITAETFHGISVTFPDETVIHAELAQTMTERVLGLMYRDAFKENEGMLFQFDDDEEHSITMRNMRFDLDVVFFRDDGKITALFEFLKHPKNAEEEEMPPARVSGSGRYVLELLAGSAEKYGLRVGDTLRIGPISQRSGESAEKTVLEQSQ